MDRKEFLRRSFYGLTILTLSSSVGQCLGGCSGDSTTGPTNVDFTLDLSQSANAALKTVGGYLRTNGVIVACIAANTYIAVQSACTHEGTQIDWQQSQNRFHCSNHGATFSKDGTVTGGPARTNLMQYKTSLSGTLLHITS